jgi:hypothetical protein
MLAKDSAAMPSPAAPIASALLTSGYDLNVAFTFHNADRTTTTDSASAAAALQAAITAGNVQHWLAGPEVDEYDVETTVNLTFAGFGRFPGQGCAFDRLEQR